MGGIGAAGENIRFREDALADMLKGEAGPLTRSRRTTPSVFTAGSARAR
jgi:hypothetical protein